MPYVDGIPNVISMELLMDAQGTAHDKPEPPTIGWGYRKRFKQSKQNEMTGSFSDDQRNETEGRAQ